MRYLALMAVLSCPLTSSADGSDPAPMIDVTRLAFAVSTFDVNGDNVPDRLVLVRNQAGDAVDLISFISDPQTGLLGDAEIAPAILPAGQFETRRDLQTIGWANSPETGVADVPVLWGTDGTFSAELTLLWINSGWMVKRARHARSDLMGREVAECVVDYQADDNRSKDKNLTEPAVILQPYLWRRRLPDACLAG